MSDDEDDEKNTILTCSDTRAFVPNCKTNKQTIANGVNEQTQSQIPREVMTLAMTCFKQMMRRRIEEKKPQISPKCFNFSPQDPFALFLGPNETVPVKELLFAILMNSTDPLIEDQARSIVTEAIHNYQWQEACDTLLAGIQSPSTPLAFRKRALFVLGDWVYHAAQDQDNQLDAVLCNIGGVMAKVVYDLLMRSIAMLNKMVNTIRERPSNFDGNISIETDPQEISEGLYIIGGLIRCRAIKLNQIPSEAEGLLKLTETIFSSFGDAITLFRSFKDEVTLRQLWKGMIRTVKLLIFASDINPKDFIPAFANSLVCCCKQLTKLVFHVPSKHETKFLVQCMRFVRQSFEWWFFQSKWWSSSSHNPPNDHFVLIQWFEGEDQDRGHLENVLLSIINKHILMHPSDLALWESDPLEFIADIVVTTDWLSRPRLCAEVLLSTIVRWPSQYTLQHVFEKMLRHMNNVFTASKARQVSNETVIAVEGCYTVLGIASYEIRNIFPIENFIRDQVVVDVNNADPRYKIVRRSVAFFLGQYMNTLWVEEKRTINSVQSSSLIYQVHCLLAKLLQDSDIVVRLAAVIAIRMSIDSNDFVAEKFLPFFDVFVKGLFQLSLELADSNVEIPPLMIFQIMIKRLVNTAEDESHLYPYFNSTIPYFKELWLEAKERPQLRLNFIRSLSTAAKYSNGDLDAFVLEVIQFISSSYWGLGSSSANRESAILMDDLLQLWLSILKRSVSNGSVTPAVAAGSVLLSDIFSVLLTQIPLWTQKESDVSGIFKLLLSITKKYVRILGKEFLETNNNCAKIINVCESFLFNDQLLVKLVQTKVYALLLNMLVAEPEIATALGQLLEYALTQMYSFVINEDELDYQLAVVEFCCVMLFQLDQNQAFVPWFFKERLHKTNVQEILEDVVEKSTSILEVYSMSGRENHKKIKSVVASLESPKSGWTVPIGHQQRLSAIRAKQRA
eukprot:TRINITY_DN200_c0_g4_i1.p1 TRINITY_DN200_c0_g4~~TRINITY_DN200_c0_g4_i1.p1  ORF type:complete len:960 (-),score=217.50 TRINITY_DN200_c0_g4_i1:141-3020(-)